MPPTRIPLSTDCKKTIIRVLLRQVAERLASVPRRPRRGALPEAGAEPGRPLRAASRGRGVRQDNMTSGGRARQRPPPGGPIGSRSLPAGERVHRLRLRGLGRVDRHRLAGLVLEDRKSTRLNSSHVEISYAVFCLKKKKKNKKI